MIGIGIDSGKKLAITTLSYNPAISVRARYLSKTTIDVGHKVPLAKPRKRGRGEMTEETVIDDLDIEAALDAARAEIDHAVQLGMSVEPGADIVVSIERVKRVYPRLGFTSDMATWLVHSAWIAGEIAGLARENFGAKAVSTYTESEWRKHLIQGRKSSLSEDQQIAKALPFFVEDWPDVSNEHERDGALLSYYGLKFWYMRRVAAVRGEFNRIKVIQ